jgi:hypothetical protein
MIYSSLLCYDVSRPMFHVKQWLFFVVTFGFDGCGIEGAA